jgi:hypothetical protein
MSVRATRWFFPIAAAALAVGGLRAQEEGRGARGDGRGLTTFGDRGLTTFGDRFSEGYGRRPLTSFGDIPLVPMGGLVPNDGPSRSSPPSRRLRNSHPAPRSGAGRTSWSRRSSALRSVASIDGEVFTPSWHTTTIVDLPDVRLPTVTLDPRPALESLQASLESELERVRGRGDLDLARSLAATLGR